MRNSSFKLLVAVLTLASGPVAALADWDAGDGHKMHHPQLPIDLVNPNFNGIDVAFWNGRLADDWMCSASGPVSDIHFWISWNHNEVIPFDAFWVRIWSNNPMGPDGYSIPDQLLWERPFQVGEFIMRPMEDHIQDWFNPWQQEYLPEDHFLWHQINIVDIPEPFIQEQGRIYWLEIDIPENPTVGWKVSGSPHFEDDAVYWAGDAWRELYHPYTGESLDLAFVITGGEMVGCWLCCPFEGLVLMDPAGAGLSSVDFDSDFDVDIADFAQFIACLVGPYDPCCDYDCNGVANIADFAIFAAHYQHNGTVFCDCP